jgi:hypothetical protein
MAGPVPEILYTLIQRRMSPETGQQGRIYIGKNSGALK